MQEHLSILRPYFRGSPLIILAMIFAYMAANKYLSYTTPMFESSAKLRLADLGEGIPNSNLFKDFDVFASSNKIAAEIEVIKSAMLIDKTLARVPFDFQIFRVGELKRAELFPQAPIAIRWLNTDHDHLDFTFDLTLDSMGRWHLYGPEGMSAEGYLGDTARLAGTALKIELDSQYMARHPDINWVDRYQFVHHSRKKLIEKIQGGLDVMSLHKDVAIIRVSYKSAIPAKTTLLANALVETYIEDYIESKFQAANVTVDFLNRQIDDVMIKLSSAEKNMLEYRNAEQVTNIRQETETDLRSIAQLEIQATNLRMSLDAIRQLETYVQEGKDDFLNLAPNFEAFTDLLSTELVKNIKSLQAEKKDLLIEYTPEHERVKVIDAKIEDLTLYLMESIRNTRKNLEVKYRNLLNDLEFSRTKLVDVPEKEKMLTILNREFQIYQQTYNFLNEKKIEAEIAQAARIAFHRVIAPARIPTEPISPNYTIIKIVAMMLAFFLAIIAIFVVHQLKAKVNDKKSIEARSLIPIAIETPKLRQTQAIIQHFQSEVIQLEFKGLLQARQILCLSAFKYKEGSTFHAVHLANALARQGRSVLLIDVDDQLQKEHRWLAGLHEKVTRKSLTASDYLYHTRRDWEEALSAWSSEYDITLILNAPIGEQLALVMQALAHTNLMMADCRLTPLRRITDIDLLQEEYNLPSTHFVLNRTGYNPNIIREIWVIVRNLCFLLHSKLHRA